MPKPQTNIKKLLTSVVERIETLEDQKQGIADDIKDIFLESKGNGLDRATIKEMLKLRKLDADDRAEKEFLRDQYAKALDLISDLV